MACGLSPGSVSRHKCIHLINCMQAIFPASYSQFVYISFLDLTVVWIQEPLSVSTSISVKSFYVTEVVLNCYRHFWINLFNIRFSVLFSFLKLSTTTSLLHFNFTVSIKKRTVFKRSGKNTFCVLNCLNYRCLHVTDYINWNKVLPLNLLHKLLF